MKRIALALCWLALSVGAPADAQMGTFFPGPGTAHSSGSLDPATTAWVNQVVTNGGTVSGGRQTVVDTFIVCLKSASLFTTLDRYWLLAGENTQSALTDMAALSSATNVSSFPFTANTGYGPSNTASFLDTGTVTLTQCTQNSCTFGGQDQTATVPATQNYAIYGAANGAFTQLSYFKPGTSSAFNEAAISSASNSGFASTSARFSWSITRTGATAGAVYANGSTTAPGGTIGTTSSPLPAVAFFIGGINQGGSLVAPNTTDVVSSFFIASGWNSTQAGNFESCQNAMMTSIGINVH